MKTKPAHKPHRPLRRRLGAMCVTRKVRVEFEQDGHTVVKESTIALKAGDQRTLEVGAEEERVAAAR